MTFTVDGRPGPGKPRIVASDEERRIAQDRCRNLSPEMTATLSYLALPQDQHHAVKQPAGMKDPMVLSLLEAADLIMINIPANSSIGFTDGTSIERETLVRFRPTYHSVHDLMEADAQGRVKPKIGITDLGRFKLTIEPSTTAAESPAKPVWKPDPIELAILRTLRDSPTTMTREELQQAIGDICATLKAMRPRVDALIELKLIAPNESNRLTITEAGQQAIPADDQ